MYENDRLAILARTPIALPLVVVKEVSIVVKEKGGLYQRGMLRAKLGDEAWKVILDRLNLLSQALS